jgi:2'-5' RNA ligase
MSFSLALSATHIQPDLKKLKVGLSRGKNFIYDFVPQEELHIPLCHLTTSEGMVEKMEKVLACVPPLELKLREVGAYPDAREARLLWIGVQNSLEIRSLRALLLDAVAIPMEDDDYQPILPVVRLKNHRSVADIISPFKNADFGKALFDQVALLEMESRGPFPTFNTLHRFTLNFSRVS